jgi:hypothetical protein
MTNEKAYNREKKKKKGKWKLNMPIKKQQNTIRTSH